ncbi:MAG: helix-turn-helix domain-containing protein [bacterium]|jgi:DNA-binding Lrp family transcriptional regulator
MLSQVDIPIALALVELPDATYQQIAHALGISTSTAHDGVNRLREAGLVAEEGRRVNHLALLELLEHAAKYLFRTKPGAVRLGVPTAHSGPDLAPIFDVPHDAYVWPSPNGTVRGRAVEPLVPRATEIAERSPGLYATLALVDALRVGRARERNQAMIALRRRLGRSEGPVLSW